jgi:pimeloyl-ACP methyl ester carboxylesterase
MARLHVAALAVCMIAACGERSATRHVELVECRVPRLAGAAQCGSIEVPENRSQPDGRKIAIAFMVLPANTLSPKPDPLFMLAGGPGQSAVALAPLANALGGVRRNRDIVLVDPRGGGKSSPLRCAALAPRDPFDEFADDEPAQAARRCLREIEAEAKVDVAQYTTPALVADIDAIRSALGYDRVNLWGGSYGTRVAQEYARRYPKRVRAMVLDGVAPPAMRISLDIWPAREAALAQLFAACAEDEACKRAYPDLNATLAEIKHDLGAGRRVSVADPRTGASREVLLTFDMVVGALQALIYVPEFASLTPSLIAQAGSGNYAPLAAAALVATQDAERSMNMVLHYAVTCAEDAPRVGAAETRQILAGLRAPALAERNLAACEGWPRPTLPVDFNAPLVSDTPVLILSGGLDPVTPPDNGKKVAETLPNARHVVAAGYGHIVSPHTCAPRLIEKFIDEAGFDTLPQSCLDYFARSVRPPLFASLLQMR